MKICLEHSAKGPETGEGLVFIPDISGFTELVQSARLETGSRIIYELLEAVILSENTGLQVSEIEGDAVLFYRMGEAPAFTKLTRQYELIVSAFESRKRVLEKKYDMTLSLSLKAVAHYGAMTKYTLGRFEKLYGEVVVEAHRLLKNSVLSRQYLLITDALLEKTGQPDTASGRENSFRAGHACERYGSIRNICFTCLDYSGQVIRRVA